MKTVKVRLEVSGRSDLMCIACGLFQTDYALAPVARNLEPQVGIHKGCIGLMHMKRGEDHGRSRSKHEGQANGSEPEGEG